MVFKVFYQADRKINPRRENTNVLYLEAESEVQARILVETHANDALIEHIEALDAASLEYEQQSPDFKLTEFDANEEA